MSAGGRRPAFSVITPVYNGAGFIERSYAMLAAQTFPDWEWIVVDDGSTDGTAQKVRAISDPRVRLLAHAANRGRGSARARALDAARGDWMVVWDADDLYFPDRLERIERARAAGFDFCCSYAAVVDNGFRLNGVRGFHPAALGLPRHFVHHTLGCRLEIARQIGYDPALAAGEDATLVWVLGGRWRGEFVEDALTVYMEEREISVEKAIRTHRAQLAQLWRIWRRRLLPLTAPQWLALSARSLAKLAVLQMMRLAPGVYRATLALRTYGETAPGYALPADRAEFIRRMSVQSAPAHR